MKNKESSPGTKCSARAETKTEQRHDIMREDPTLRVIHSALIIHIRGEYLTVPVTTVVGHSKSGNEH